MNLTKSISDRFKEVLTEYKSVRITIDVDPM